MIASTSLVWISDSMRCAHACPIAAVPTDGVPNSRSIVRASLREQSVPPYSGGLKRPRTEFLLRSRLVDRRCELLGSLPRGVKVVDHEPQEKPIAYIAPPRIGQRRPIVIASGTGPTSTMKAQQNHSVAV